MTKETNKEFKMVADDVLSKMSTKRLLNVLKSARKHLNHISNKAQVYCYGDTVLFELTQITRYFNKVKRLCDARENVE